MSGKDGRAPRVSVLVTAYQRAETLYVNEVWTGPVLCLRDRRWIARRPELMGAWSP